MFTFLSNLSALYMYILAWVSNISAVSCIETMAVSGDIYQFLPYRLAPRTCTIYTRPILWYLRMTYHLLWDLPTFSHFRPLYWFCKWKGRSKVRRKRNRLSWLLAVFQSSHAGNNSGGAYRLWKSKFNDTEFIDINPHINPTTTRVVAYPSPGTDPQRSFDSHRFANGVTRWSTPSPNDTTSSTYGPRGSTNTAIPKPIYNLGGSVIGKQMRSAMVGGLVQVYTIRPHNKICNWTASFVCQRVDLHPQTTLLWSM